MRQLKSRLCINCTVVYALAGITKHKLNLQSISYGTLMQL